MTDKTGENPKRKGSGALWPLVISALLLCGIGYCIWHFLSLRGERQAEENAEAQEFANLTNRRDELKKLLLLAPCDAKKAVVPVNPGHSALEPGTGTAMALPSAEPAAPAKPTAAAEPARKGPGGRLEDIESACVFIVSTDGRNSFSTGSGFFVAPNYVVTNRHVVEKGLGKVLVTNKSLGHAAIARVVATSKGKNDDYALLKVDMPPGSHTGVLPFANGVAKTEKIGAWGFPDVIGKNDPAYQRLLAGADVSAVPELTYTEGVVSAVLQRKPDIIVHTAPISPGSSGGPLLNEDGQVVGINTMITLDETSYRQASLALAAKDLLGFLNSQGITP